MRLDSAMAKELAKDFARSSVGRIWSFVDDVIRHALISQVVMQHARRSDAADAQKPVTPAELIAFEDYIITLLDVGVRTGTGRVACRFDERSES